MESLVDVMSIVSHIIAVASIIVKITPDTKDDQALDKVMKVLRFLSLAK
jgi:SepF-like predicted cell division protein (DUF552 family)